MTPFVRLWLWVSAFASLAGWGLSAAGELNRTGYAAAFAVFAVFIFLRRKDLGTKFKVQSLKFKVQGSKFKVFRRFRRLLPFCFGALAVLIFVGGAIHAPGNYTGLTYRTGRVLQWLSHEHWFWIHTADFRMNDRACGIEWLSAPMLLFTGSTRGLFLLNFLPFLLLPGLIFSIFTRLGVRARVAWQWMWLLPTGYNFLLQAGGIANDTFPTVYALAAVDFALRAMESRLVAGRLAGTLAPPAALSGVTALPDLWHSILAAALLTGAKASNLPLLLPWAVVIFPLLPLLRKKIAATALVILVAAAVSFLPTAILNAHFLGDWSGLSIERTGMDMKNPLTGVWGNGLLLALDNFTPPLFPFAGWWNAHALAALPHFISGPMTANFEPGFLWLGELPTEDWAGIGFGLSALLAVSVVANFFNRNSRRPSAFSLQPSVFLLLAPWLALFAFCMKSGMVTPNRLIAPYYPLLLPGLLAGAGQSQIVRRGWWRALAGGVLILAFVVLILTPDRPLWPAQTVLSGLAARNPNAHWISRALDVYSVYAKRPDPLADVRALLPDKVQTVGFIGAEDDCDISLWLPLGSRRVEHFLLSDPPERFRQAGVEYVVVGGLNLQLRGTTLDDWMQKAGAELVAGTHATQKVSEGPQTWYVVRFK
jgi:hypothetical protein